MKALIFDSGALITLSMNGLLYVLEELKRNFPGKFLITHSVKREVIDRPINVPRFELGALRVQNLIDLGVLELPESLGVSQEEIQKETQKLMTAANDLIRIDGKPIDIVSEGEMSCLALSAIISKKNIDSIIAIDERTTRILAEKPESLEQLISKKMHKRAELKSQNISLFSKFRFIRSSELVYVAFKKGVLNISGPKTLEAVLYATKFTGSSISFDEIKALKKL